MPFQLSFALDELKRRLPDEPAWKDDPMVQAALPTLLADHYKGLFHIIDLTGSGMTTEEFAVRVRAWFTNAKHPRFDRPYDQLVYQPMLEVLEFFRANVFTTRIRPPASSSTTPTPTANTPTIPAPKAVANSSKPSPTRPNAGGSSWT